MTTVEMHHSIISKLSTINYPAETIDSYRAEKLLNEAQYLFIERYVPLLKESEVARKKLHPLIKNSELTPAAHSATVNMSDYGVTVTLPSDYHKALNEYITTSSDVVDVKPIDYDEYNSNRDNPFKKPYSRLVWRLELNVSAREHELIPDSTTGIVKYRLRYIKVPTVLSIISNNTSDLRVEDHEEIVNLAIGIIVRSKNGVNNE
jgi:hypothetical protein